MLADSFARIFFRNAVNLGLVPVVCKGVSQAVKEGQTITLDLGVGTVAVRETGEVIPCEKLGNPFPSGSGGSCSTGSSTPTPPSSVCPS